MNHKYACLRWLRCSKGSTILEFAIVAPILLLLILGIIQYAIVIMGQATMDAAVVGAARELKTANNNNTNTGSCGVSGQSQAQYLNCLVNCVTGGIFDKSKLMISAKKFDTYDQVSVATFPTCTNYPVTCTAPNVPAGCGTPPCSEDFGTPGDQQIIEFSATYPWPIIVPFLSQFFGSPSASLSSGLGTFNIVAYNIVRNEPDSSTGHELSIVTTTTNNGNCAR